MVALNRGLEKRRGDFVRVESFLPKNVTAAGLYLVEGRGESSRFVGFPVRFAEKPLFYFGSEIASEGSVTVNSFPVVSATVNGWEFNKIGNKRYYTGANIVSVVSGDDIPIFIHWFFIGKSATAPSFAGNELEDII